MTVDAELRTSCSLLDRPDMPGKGRNLLLQTSASRASSLIRSAIVGASVFRGFVVRSDCDLLIVDSVADLELSLTVVVFLSTT